jgi:OOP family OmpA-OmpF porin
MGEAAVGRDVAPASGPDDRRPQPPVDPSPAAQLAELRSILVGPEQQDLQALQAHVFDGAVQTREVSRVLPEAFELRSQDPKLARALAPMVENAITSSVHRDPKPLADALFPVMGPAIRRAIEHMLASMMESFNRTVEQSLSWRALTWRWTAWRSGKSFAEVVLLNTLRYRVEQVFMIHAESGLLLQHVSAQTHSVQDADQVSAMLTAIRDFVKDSFRVGSTDSLEGFRVGELSVIVEQGPYAMLAGVVRCAAPPDLRTDFCRALESIHLLLGNELRDYKGDGSPFERARPTLEGLLVTRLRDEQKPVPYRRWAVVAALVVAALAFWGFQSYRQRQRWAAYLDRLSSEPGIVVVSTGRRTGHYVVNGMRDPLAADPASFLSDAGLAPGSVEGRWEPYEAQRPQFVVSRAEALLHPPEGVTLSFENGVLEARGPAPERWLIDAERLAPTLTGVARFRYAGPSAVDTMASKLQSLSVLFPKGKSDLMPEEMSKVAIAAALLTQFSEALRVSGKRAQIEVLGSTDTDGSDESNGPLSTSRAVKIRNLLSATPLDGIELTARGVGSTMPATAGANETEKMLNRRASMRVTISDTRQERGR